MDRHSSRKQESSLAVNLGSVPAFQSFVCLKQDIQDEFHLQDEKKAKDEDEGENLISRESRNPSIRASGPVSADRF